MTYFVQTFAAAGVYVPTDERRFASLQDARAEARRRLRVSRLSPQRRTELAHDDELWSGSDDDLVPVEAWNALTAAQADRIGVACGGVAIYRTAEA